MESKFRGNILANAKFKSHEFGHRTGQWCGCLTPQEIIALFNAGIRDRDGKRLNKSKYFQDALTCKMFGRCKPYWFYFFPNGLNMRSF